MAWRFRSLAARRSQSRRSSTRNDLVKTLGPPDALVDFHTGRHGDIRHPDDARAVVDGARRVRPATRAYVGPSGGHISWRGARRRPVWKSKFYGAFVAMPVHHRWTEPAPAFIAGLVKIDFHTGVDIYVVLGVVWGHGPPQIVP